MPEVWIPPRMQTLAGGREQVVIDGASVRQVVTVSYTHLRAHETREDRVLPVVL